MKNQIVIEANVDGLGKIYHIMAPFDYSLSTLRKLGIQKPISPRDLAYARIMQGKSSSLSIQGSYTSAAVLYAKDSYPLLALNSPLSNLRLAKKATQSNREDIHFSTDNLALYEKYFKLAEIEAGKEPEKKKAMLLPSTGDFRISMSKHPKVTKMVFKDIAESYMAFLGKDSILVYLTNKELVNAKTGTIITPVLLGGLNDSDLDCDDTNLDCNYDVRGLEKEGRKCASHTKKIDEAYTPAQITDALKTVKIDGLESLIIKALRANN